MTVYLLPMSEMGSDPKTFYAVARAPGLLAGMAYLYGLSWQALHKFGYHHVVCLTDNNPGYNPAPLSLLCAERLQDLAGEVLPQRPDHEEHCIREAVARILPRLRDGEGVAVHCIGGTGRTGTVVACTLKALGVEPSVVLKHMNSVNVARTKYPGWKGWPESPWQRALFDRM